MYQAGTLLPKVLNMLFLLPEMLFSLSLLGLFLLSFQISTQFSLLQGTVSPISLGRNTIPWHSGYRFQVGLLPWLQGRIYVLGLANQKIPSAWPHAKVIASQTGLWPSIIRVNTGLKTQKDGSRELLSAILRSYGLWSWNQGRWQRTWKWMASGPAEPI